MNVLLHSWRVWLWYLATFGFTPRWFVSCTRSWRSFRTDEDVVPRDSSVLPESGLWVSADTRRGPDVCYHPVDVTIDPTSHKEEVTRITLRTVTTHSLVSPTRVMFRNGSSEGCIDDPPIDGKGFSLLPSFFGKEEGSKDI